MASINEIIGNILTLDIEEYYIFDYKVKGLDYYCLGFRVSPQFADEKIQIIRLFYSDGNLKAIKYNGEDYQSMLDDFMEKENYIKCLQELMNKYNR